MIITTTLAVASSTCASKQNEKYLEPIQLKQTKKRLISRIVNVIKLISKMTRRSESTFYKRRNQMTNKYMKDTKILLVT